MPEIRTRTTRTESSFGTDSADLAMADRSPWDWYAECCHPEDDLIDGLRGSIRDALPDNGAPALNLTRVHAPKDVLIIAAPVVVHLCTSA